jgi:hypothetical protein
VSANPIPGQTDIFGESIKTQQIIDVFNKNKTWFKAEKGEGSVKRKLLNVGLAFAKSVSLPTK